MKNQPWYHNAVFYELAVRSFKDSNGDGIGDLPGLVEKLDYLQSLGVDCIWLLPIYPSPLKDDGYDIADYCNIASQYGTLEDFGNLVKAAHEHDIRVVMDLVLNHTSDEHPWFKAAREDRNSPYRDYYVWSDSDRKYARARVIFVDTESSNWTYDEQARQYYWHRFYACQPDLNFDNPAVREEMLRVAGFWLERGIDGFRVDAVPYLFEREDTICENLPETHAFLKQLRAFVEREFPGRVLLCEANQWPEDIRPYLGDGDEFHMGFHFPLMPRIFMALKKESLKDVVEVLDRTPPIPESCQWCTFLRNHDELTLEMVTEEDRLWMWEQYAPEPRMRLNLGVRRRLAPLLDNDRRKIRLAMSLLFTLPGAPIVYYGDEIGMGDNLNLPDRNGLRTPMQWNGSSTGGFTSGVPWAALPTDEFSPARVSVEGQQQDPTSLLHAVRRMISVRKQRPELGTGGLGWIETGNASVGAYLREKNDSRLLILSNLSAREQAVRLPATYLGDCVNVLTETRTRLRDSSSLGPFEFQWLQPLA